MKEWRAAVQEADWRHFADIKKTFGDADWVNGLIHFQYQGNDYRLIAIAAFENDKLYIKNVMTHAE